MKSCYFEETKVKNQAYTSVVQTSLGPAEENTHSDNWGVFALLSVFGFVVLVLGIVWWFYKRPAPDRHKQPVDTDPIETSKIPLYQESGSTPHYPIMPPK